MTVYVALLRAVNVGGTGKLPMRDLKALCQAAGFETVRTYIASGNALFRSERPETAIKASLEAALLAYGGRPVGVLVRTAAEMAAVAADNPFPEADPKRVAVVFLDAPPPPDAAERVSGRRDEEVRLGRRELYVFYPGGMGRSKLKLAAARDGTARNMNTVAKLAGMAAELQRP